MSDRFVYTTTEDPLAVPLIEDLILEYDSRYGTFFDPRGARAEVFRYPPAIFAPPHGNFLLLLRGSETIAGGAFMRHEDDGTAEFKRIWTHKDYRRQGLARRVLLELEAQAERQGYSRIYLTTGFRQPEAVGLYLANGYRALFNQGDDLEALKTLPFEKFISGVPAGHLQERPADSNSQARQP